MKDIQMKQLMNMAEQLDKHVSNFPYQINVLSETHTFNNMHTGILAKGLWGELKKNGNDALFENGCYDHTEYLDTAFCDMNENSRYEILLRCYKPFFPVLNVVYEYLYNDNERLLTAKKNK